jgi:RimJ/RimL family protein N-acetyltransferase
MTFLECQPAGLIRGGNCAPIETPRLVLRAPRPQDAQAVTAIANDLRIAQNTSRLPHPYEVRDPEAFIAQLSSDREIAFLITLAGPEAGYEIIGVCAIAMTDRSGPELGYWIGVRHWGKGYATEAARAAIDHAFVELGHDTLSASVRVSNPASRRVLEKCGFQWTGVELRRIRAIASAAPFDRFRLDRGLWTSLKEWGKVLAATRSPHGASRRAKGATARAMRGAPDCAIKREGA